MNNKLVAALIIAFITIVIWQNNKINNLHEALKASWNIHTMHSEINQDQYEILDIINNRLYSVEQRVY